MNHLIKKERVSDILLLVMILILSFFQDSLEGFEYYDDLVLVLILLALMQSVRSFIKLKKQIRDEELFILKNQYDNLSSVIYVVFGCGFLFLFRETEGWVEISTYLLASVLFVFLGVTFKGSVSFKDIGDQRVSLEDGTFIVGPEVIELRVSYHQIEKLDSGESSEQLQQLNLTKQKGEELFNWIKRKLEVSTIRLVWMEE